MLYGALGRTNPCTRRSAGLVALALTAVLGRAHGQSEVSGCEFTHGDGRVERFGNGFLIFAEGGRVIMQCDRFNVGPGNGVEFRQDGATARLLNRINGDFGPSDINGSLTANGIIFIVNPAGVFFGNGALVNVGGIYAASGNITDSDFLADTYRFDTSAGDMVRVDPRANIAATQMVHLIGRQVANHGDISVGTGTVALIAANDEVIITEMGERISVQVDGVNLDRDLRIGAPETPVLTGDVGVENTGTIEVTSGQVVLGASDMYALAIRNTGDILVGGNDGAAQLTALAGTVLHEGSIRAADVAMTGGVIFLDDDVQADEALFNDAVVLGSDITIEGTDGSATNVEFVSTVDSEEDEENGLAVDSADTTFGGAVGGNDVLGDLDVSGRTQIDGGSITTTGLQRYGGAVTLGADTTLAAGDEFATGVRFDDAVDGAQALTLEAATTFGGVVGGGEALSSLLVDGTAVINTTSITTDGDQAYRGAVTLGEDAELNADNVAFDDTVDGAHALTLNADTTFGGVVGGGEALSSLLVDGTAAINTTSITTDGDQAYRGAVTLGEDAELNADNVAFDDTVDGAHALTVNADTTFGGVVGGGEALSSLLVDGTAAINTTSITTDGDQAYRGAVTLGEDAELNADNVAFDDTVDGAHALTVNADTTFGGVVGGGEALSSLLVDGTAAINTTSITTDGDQAYRGAVTLGEDAELNADNVAFDDTVDGAHALTLNADTTFGGVVGGGEALSSLLVDGTAAINTTSITTDGDQEYVGAVTLGEDAELNAENVAFDDTVDGAHALTLNADTTFGGVVGDDEALSSLLVDGTAVINTTSITTDGDQAYRGAVTLGEDAELNAENVAFDDTVDGAHALTLNADTTFGGVVGGGEALSSLLVDGTAVINTTSITTDGDQAYRGAVTLGEDAELNAENVAFDDTVDGAHALTLNADTTFGGVVGGGEALSSLLVDGTAAINTTSITTDGDQEYVGAVTLGEDAELNAENVAFDDTVDGAHALTLNADTTFGGVVGGGEALTTLDVNGLAQLDGGSIETTGLQRYRGAVTLGADTTLTAGETLETGVQFDEAVDGAQTLTLDAATTFGGKVGADDALTSLDVRGVTQLDGRLVATTGQQRYREVVTLGDKATLRSGGEVRFDAAVEGGGHDLTIDADEATFKGDVHRTGDSTVIVVNDVTFRGRISEAGDFDIDAGGDAVFAGKIEDTGAFVVTAGDNVTFRKSIGTEQAVKSLRVKAGSDESDRIVFSGGDFVINATGDVLLNEGVHAGIDPGEAATIVGRGGDLRITSSGGEFRMGRNEKMSVEGSLTINGGSQIEKAVLSDINTSGDLTVDARVIEILRRSPGLAFAPGESDPQPDQGVDFVAGGQFFFTTKPKAVGGGLDPQFATPDGQGDATGSLSSFVMRSFGSSLGTDFISAEQDLLATGASTTDPAEARAAAPTRETELADVRDQNPFPAGLDRELAEQLAILPRLLSPVEISARLDGRYLYFDEWPTLVNPNAQDYHEVVIYRLFERQAVEALDTYQALRGRESQIRDRLGEAVFAYREEFGDDAALGGLGATWLAQEDYRDLVEDLQRLNLVLATIAEIGMTASELERPRRVILESFRPKEEIESREELLEVLRTLPETPNALDETAPVSGDDAEATG